MLKRAVIVHHPSSEGAAVFANQLLLELGRQGVEAVVGDRPERDSKRPFGEPGFHGRAVAVFGPAVTDPSQEREALVQAIIDLG